MVLSPWVMSNEGLMTLPIGIGIGNKITSNVI